MIILDYYTRFIGAYPSKTRDVNEAHDSIHRFCGVDARPKAVYSDNAPEIIAAVRPIGGHSATCTPHVPATNGAAENCVRKVTEGTACSLDQSGFSFQWWNAAMQCFTFLRNACDIQHFGTTPYFARFGVDFKGLRIPFGAEISYMKFEMETKVVRDHPFGPNPDPPARQSG